MMLMADPVSMSASCGVLLHKILTKTGVKIDEIDDFGTPQGSSPSSDPLIRKNDALDNHALGG